MITALDLIPQPVRRLARGLDNRVFRSVDPTTSPYQTDWVVRVLLSVARMLEYPIYKFRGEESSERPSAVSVGLVVVLSFPLVVILTAWTSNVLLPGSKNVEVALAEDYPYILLMIMTPISGVLAVDFYYRVDSAFSGLSRIIRSGSGNLNRGISGIAA